MQTDPHHLNSYGSRRVCQRNSHWWGPESWICYPTSRRDNTEHPHREDLEEGMSMRWVWLGGDGLRFVHAVSGRAFTAILAEGTASSFCQIHIPGQTDVSGFIIWTSFISGHPSVALMFHGVYFPVPRGHPSLLNCSFPVQNSKARLPRAESAAERLLDAQDMNSQVA